MFKSFLVCILFCIVMFIEGSSQSSTPQPVSTAVWHQPSSDKESWQRLNLLLSATYWRVVKEGQLDFDSCLLYTSRSLGLSRLSLLADGVDDPELLAQSQWIDLRDPGKGIQLLSKSTGKKRLEVLLLLGAYYSFQPQGYYNKDSVEYFLAKAINESKTINEVHLARQALCLLGKMYFEVNDAQHADSVFNRLTTECKEAGDYESEARAFEYWALYPTFSPATTENRIKNFQIAADEYHNLGKIEGEINALTDIGYLLVTTVELQKSYTSFLKAFQLEEAIRYPYTHYNTDPLALVTSAEGKFGEPLRYSLQTIKAAESSRDSIGWPYFYNRLVSLYKSEGSKEKECQDWSDKALNRFLIDRNPALYNLLNDKIDRMSEEGREKEALDLVIDISKKIPPVSFTDLLFYHLALSICYNNLHQFELAEMHLLKADSMETKAEPFRGPLRRSEIYGQYGNIYFKQRQYLKAKLYWEKSLSAPLTGSRTLTADIFTLRKLIDLDSILKDPVAGLAQYKLYTQLLDSNFRVTQVRQAEELQVIYQTQEKENQIDLLNHQAKLEESNLKQATLVKNLTIAGIVAVVIIAGLLYRQNRLKQKNNNLISHKNEQLQHYLSEKEWLLREIHHRVKNNLQIVMSLLNSQSAYINSEAALTAIHDSQHRVHAMSLIHQKLYGSENLSTIDVSLYIRELVSYLADSFDTGSRIHFELSIEPLELDVSQAVPLGLILNEAITNSIKYAFPDDRNGIISISLNETSPRQYLLLISDNGIGMPANFDNKRPGSLGMSLMYGLSEDINGHFSIENNNGTTIRVSFIHNLNFERSDTLAPSVSASN